MKHWIFMFQPDTYEIVKSLGLVGATNPHRARFSELSEGDKFITYVSRKGLLDGYGAISSEPFTHDDFSFGENKSYPQRCKVLFMQTGASVEVKDLLWGLSVFSTQLMKTVPANYLFLKGGFMEITAQDFEWLMEQISEAQKK